MSSVAEFYIPPKNLPPTSSIQWIQCSNGNFPDNAVQCGLGGDKVTKLYVARARFQTALLPGKCHPKFKTCFVPWGGKENSVPHYEVLTAPSGSVCWVPSSHGILTANAVVGGYTEGGEQLYIGRGEHDGFLTCGKVQPSHKVCYIALNGKEIKLSNYELLVRAY